MHKILFKGLPIAFALVFTTGCSESIDIEASKQNFFAHQENFSDLSNVACTFAESNNINFFRYPLDVQVEQAEAFKSEFGSLERLLNAIDSELIVIRDFADYHCELYVKINGMSFLGEGISLGYVYQPVDLGGYEYTEDFFSAENKAHRKANRTRGEDVKFSIELQSGWYLQYHLYP